MSTNDFYVTAESRLDIKMVHPIAPIFPARDIDFHLKKSIRKENPGRRKKELKNVATSSRYKVRRLIYVLKCRF
jgi:hypothetical protein